MHHLVGAAGTELFANLAWFNGSTMCHEMQMMKVRRNCLLQGGAHHLVGVADTEIRPAAAPHDEEGDEKYVKRNTALKRSLQRVFPSLFQPGLPITNRCIYILSSFSRIEILSRTAESTVLETVLLNAKEQRSRSAVL